MNRLISFIVVVALAAIPDTRPCPAAETPPPGEGWVSLFNGQDLTGWILPPPGKEPWQVATWKVVDGTIDCSGGTRTLISAADYSDFILRLRWRWKHDSTKPTPMKTVPFDGKVRKVIQYDSGIFLRAETLDQYVNRPGTDLIGGPIQINLWAMTEGSGNGGGKLAVKQADRPLGEWNEMEITCQAGLVQVVLNGERVNSDVPLPRGTPSSGRLHLQAHGGDSMVQFKDLWIKELTP